MEGCVAARPYFFRRAFSAAEERHRPRLAAVGVKLGRRGNDRPTSGGECCLTPLSETSGLDAGNRCPHACDIEWITVFVPWEWVPKGADDLRVSECIESATTAEIPTAHS